MATSKKARIAVLEIQEYPASFPREYENAIAEVNKDLSGSHYHAEGEYAFDGLRYQCKVLVTPEALRALKERYPEAY